MGLSVLGRYRSLNHIVDAIFEIILNHVVPRGGVFVRFPLLLAALSPFSCSPLLLAMPLPGRHADWV